MIDLVVGFRIDVDGVSSIISFTFRYNYFKNKEIQGTLTNYFKYKAKRIPEIVAITLQRVSEILSNYCKNKRQGVPEIERI